MIVNEGEKVRIIKDYWRILRLSELYIRYYREIMAENDTNFESMTGLPEDTRPTRLKSLNEIVRPKLNERFGGDQLIYSEHRDELSITVSKDQLRDLMLFLRDHDALKFSMLKDVHAVDWYRRKDRFEVIYNLFSLEHRMRLRVKCFAQENEPHVDSVVDMFPSADWYERETYDMHGVVFDGHPDLRRMYMPEDFVHPETGESLHPLRKEFPMMGVPGSLPLPEQEVSDKIGSNGLSGTTKD